MPVRSPVLLEILYILEVSAPNDLAYMSMHEVVNVEVGSKDMEFRPVYVCPPYPAGDKSLYSDCHRPATNVYLILFSHARNMALILDGLPIL